MPDSQTYSVANRSVVDLFAADSIAFQIPPFQRRYAWGAEQVSELVADLYQDEDWRKATTRARVPYFLGSIVLAKGEGPDLVLDGQQRLTTISLLIAVLKEKIAAQNWAEAIELEKYLTAGRFGQEKTAKIILQPEDEKTYSELIREPRSYTYPNLEKSRLAIAVRQISTMLDRYAQEAVAQGADLRSVLSRMVQKLLYEVVLVRIDAPSEAAAFRLFETLNDRGLLLNAADLIKNKLFMRCGDEYLSEVKEIWKEILHLVEPKEIVNFLRYYWIAFHGEVREHKLYDEFGTDLNWKQPLEAITFARDLRASAQLYRLISRPELRTDRFENETMEGLQRLATFRARSCRPVLLLCARNAPDILPAVVQACESITVRYSVIGRRIPNELERAYSRVCRRLVGNPEDVLLVLRDELDQLVPNDEEFTADFLKIRLVRVSNTWRTILERLAEISGSAETHVLRSRRVHVEHILPQKPSRAALKESGLTDEEAKELIGRMGNLTLLSGPKNQANSNGPFSRKRSGFKDSDIRLNRRIAEYDNWGKSEIEGRTQELAALAVEAWPWPILS
jgi:hypothetical protein